MEITRIARDSVLREITEKVKDLSLKCDLKNESEKNRKMHDSDVFTGSSISKHSHQCCAANHTRSPSILIRLSAS